jgi:hypothetical protein
VWTNLAAINCTMWLEFHRQMQEIVMFSTSQAPSHKVISMKPSSIADTYSRWYRSLRRIHGEGDLESLAGLRMGIIKHGRAAVTTENAGVHNTAPDMANRLAVGMDGNKLTPHGEIRFGKC